MMMVQNELMESRPLLAFISYSHLQGSWKNRLLASFQPLVHEGQITAWHDGEIFPGQPPNEEIRRSLEDSELLDSKYCRKVQIPLEWNMHRAPRLEASSRLGGTVISEAELKELASMEHTRWMRDKAQDDWRYGSPTDKPRKLHACMLPWSLKDLTPYAGFAERLGTEELSEAEKEKDRTAVRKIPTILAHAGYTIVEARSKSDRARAAAKK